MELQDKYSEALEITGKTLEEFLAWVHSFEESHITAKDSAASIAASIQSTIHWGASWPQSRRIKTIYTDGDGGILIVICLRVKVWRCQLLVKAIVRYPIT